MGLEGLVNHTRLAAAMDSDSTRQWAAHESHCFFNILYFRQELAVSFN